MGDIGDMLLFQFLIAVVVVAVILACGFELALWLYQHMYMALEWR